MKIPLLVLFSLLISASLFAQGSFEDQLIFGELSQAEASQIFGEESAGYFRYIIKEKLAVNQSGVWLWVEKSDGVCKMEWVMGFSQSGEIISELQLIHQCDNEGARAHYQSFTGSQLAQDPVFERIYLEIWVKDTSLYEPHPSNNPYLIQLKKGHSFHDNGITYREVHYRKYFTVGENLEFVQIAADSTEKSYRRYPFTYHRLLTEAELRGYAKAELRLMRNEIFADYGYQFRSEDLQQHFSAQSWYQPTTTDVAAVSPRLNWLEQQNVALIRRLEQRK
ncbi:MAG: YARHG domain-containing protein [Bacteroidota bacterium]